MPDDKHTSPTLSGPFVVRPLFTSAVRFVYVVRCVLELLFYPGRHLDEIKALRTRAIPFGMASVLLFINECSLRKSKAARRTAMVRDDMKTNEKAAFNTQVFLESAGAARKIVEFPRKVTIFTQGVPAKTVMYIQQGSVKLSVVNAVGKEAVLAILGPGDCLEKTVSQDSRFELEWLPRLHRPPCLRLKE